MDYGFRTTDRKSKVVGDIALIPLGVGSKDGLVIVDVNNSHLDRYKWSLGKRGYPRARVDGHVLTLHRLVIGQVPDGMVTDHINRDKLDNRITNLRFVTQKVNTNNSGMLNTNTSGHKGVCLDRRRGKWFAQSNFDGKHQFGGYFDTIEEAIKARKRLERNSN